MILSDNDDKAHLIIIQPTPFCNIACRYCYLPTQERLMTKRMDEAVLTKIFEGLYAENLMSDETEIVWHAGEPLTVPISFYENAIAIINRVRGDKPAPRHVIQTNATLINDQWCRFIKAHDVIIGVSLDGTQHIHDRNRLDRYARGTFDKTMRGIRLLQAYDIPVHIISVVTDYSLDYAQEMFDFFMAHNLFKLAFNIEEITGAYDQSSLLNKESRWKNFLQTMFDCQAQSDKPIVIREFKNMSRALMLADAQRNHSVTTPFGFINFDVYGNFSTFCFELMAIRNQQYDNFIFGNIMTDPIRSLLHHPKFKQVYTEIQAGISACKSSCAYFSVCGGGIPSNKISENHTFDSTETMHCRLNVKALADVLTANRVQVMPMHPNNDAIPTTISDGQ